MPYLSIAKAKKAGFPTHAEEVALSLSQINKLAAIYDRLRDIGIVKSPMAVAWTTWKKIYKKAGNGWILIKK